MPRRKQLTFHIQGLRCAGHIIEELSQLPQLANFDMTSIELTIKENRPAPKIVKKEYRHTDRPFTAWFLCQQTYCYAVERILSDYKCSFSQMDEDNPSISQ